MYLLCNLLGGGGALLVYHSILYIHPYVAKCCGSMSTGSGYAKKLYHECDIILSSIRGQAGKKLTSIIYLYFTVTNVK